MGLEVLLITQFKKCSNFGITMDDRLKIADIIKQTGQRPYPLLAGPWIYYQEWHNVVFLHLRTDLQWLTAQVPSFLTVEQCDGSAWLSVVAFEVKRLRPRFAPRFSPVSNFKEVNVRTYVTHEGKPGVYFLSIKADNRLSCALARLASGLPYQYSSFEYSGHQLKTGDMTLNFQPGQVAGKNNLDRWLTERYCLYNSKKNRNYRYDIQHIEWPLCAPQISELTLDAGFLERHYSAGAERFHFSPGVQVLTWKSVTI
jgi:uncharacterized protein YqjF (DUF2071 family)